MTKNSLASLAVPGTSLTLRVAPNARADKVVAQDGTIKISVTAPPADGKANAAAIKLLAKALGVAKTRLTLVQGHAARTKRVRLD
jgi:uncharacterized protein (TIGR00251 family)